MVAFLIRRIGKRADQTTEHDGEPCGVFGVFGHAHIKGVASAARVGIVVGELFERDARFEFGVGDDHGAFPREEQGLGGCVDA